VMQNGFITTVVNKYRSNKATMPCNYMIFKANSKAKYFICVLKHRPRPSISPSTDIAATDMFYFC